MKQDSLEFREHLKRIGFKKGHQHTQEFKERARRRMMGNKIWDNPNSKKRWLPRGVNHPDYRWRDLADLSEYNLIEYEKELLKRLYHKGKIKTPPNILFANLEMQRNRETEYYLRGLIRTEWNHTYLKHLLIVKEYEHMRENYRVCRAFFNGRWWTLKRRRSKHKAGKIIHEKFPDFYKQYRISKICVDRYRRFFKGRWSSETLRKKQAKRDEKRIIKEHTSPKFEAAYEEAVK